MTYKLGHVIPSVLQCQRAIHTIEQQMRANNYIMYFVSLHFNLWLLIFSTYPCCYTFHPQLNNFNNGFNTHTLNCRCACVKWHSSGILKGNGFIGLGFQGFKGRELQGDFPLKLSASVTMVLLSNALCERIPTKYFIRMKLGMAN